MKKILLIMLAICFCASVAFADELVSPFTRIRGIVDQFGKPSPIAKDTRIFECPIRDLRHPNMKAVKLIVADNNGNVGVAAENKGDYWMVVFYHVATQKYMVAAHLPEGELREPAEQGDSVEAADEMFQMMMDSGCLTRERKSEAEPLVVAGNDKVLCCCPTPWGGQCCKMVGEYECLPGYVPGCICR